MDADDLGHEPLSVAAVQEAADEDQGVAQPDDADADANELMAEYPLAAQIAEEKP